MKTTIAMGMDPELAALLERALSHVMTPEERRAQKISFIYGMLDNDSTLTKEDVAQWLDKHEGRIG